MKVTTCPGFDLGRGVMELGRGGEPADPSENFISDSSPQGSSLLGFQCPETPYHQDSHQNVEWVYSLTTLQCFFNLGGSGARIYYRTSQAPLCICLIVDADLCINNDRIREKFIPCCVFGGLRL